MQNEELIKALRTCARYACSDTCPRYTDPDERVIECVERTLEDAANALEAAEKRIAELEAQIPKEGEWIMDGRYNRHCSICNEDVVWSFPYCPNCGARMSKQPNDSNVLTNDSNALTDDPIIIPCRGCDDYDGYGGCKSNGGCGRTKMDGKEQNDSISRQAAIDAVKGRFSMPVDNLIVEVIGALPSAQPTIDAVEVVHGEWIDEPNCMYRCSICKSHYPSIRGYMDYNYCPNCGAKMDGKEQNDG